MAVLLLIIANIICMATIATAVPKCETYGGKDVVCNAGNTDYKLGRGLVSDNDRTTGITLRECRINEVDYEAFKALPELKYIDLSINNIEYLKLGVLDDAKGVTYLNLSHNFISSFPLGLFDQKPNVDVLDLKGNRLSKLERGVFYPMPKLRYLDLSSNLLKGKDINPFVFENCKFITFIDFSRNDMNYSPENLLQSLTALDFINLDRCTLKEVPKFVSGSNLKTMKHLMLSTNQIRKIDDSYSFANLDNLEILNLVDNHIQDIHENVFKPLLNLKMVLLRGNFLKRLPRTLFQNMGSLLNIDLSHNNIESIDVNTFRGTPLKNLNLSDNKITFLHDNFCLELRNSGAKLTKFFFNQNPWQCSCLLDILKEVKSTGIEYNDVKYNGKEPVCVTGMEFNCKRHDSYNSLYVEMYESLNKKII